MSEMVLDLRAPHQVYKTKDGRRVPGVTTVLAELNKPYLMNWYGTEEREGILRFMGDVAWSAGALRAELGAKKGEPIPAKKLAKAAKAPGKLGQRARFAQLLKGFKKGK